MLTGAAINDVNAEKVCPLEGHHGGMEQNSGAVTGRQGQPSTADTATAAGQDMLARQLGDLARDLQHHDDPDTLLVDIVQAAVALIPGTDAGSISLVTDRRHVQSKAPSSELAQQVDALQEQTGEGPCLDAV